MQQPLTLVWSPCEVYVCGDPDCGSKVLVLKGPQQDPHIPTLPKCVCGSILEVRGSVESVGDVKSQPSDLFDQDPHEYRE
jgi:hypothetical protein